MFQKETKLLAWRERQTNPGKDADPASAVDFSARPGPLWPLWRSPANVKAAGLRLGLVPARGGQNASGPRPGCPLRASVGGNGVRRQELPNPGQNHLALSAGQQAAVAQQLFQAGIAVQWGRAVPIVPE